MSQLSVPRTILGVLGGLGPAASAEFLRLLTVMAPAGRDQEHPVTYVYSNPQIPDRSAAVLGIGPSPEPFLRDGLETLVSWGAGLLAVPCNTAHIFIDRFRDKLKVPLVHIVEATVERAMETDDSGAWLLATEGTVQSGLYQSVARDRGYELRFPPDEAVQAISRSIALVKAGDVKAAAVLLAPVIQELWSSADLPVIGACTELPLAYAVSILPSAGMISSLEALAGKCVQELYGCRG